MITVAEALDRVLALAPAAPRTERVPLRAALGRVLAAPAVAGLDQPPFDASSMDGYAVRAGDLRPGAILRIAGEAAAGRGWSGAFAPGQAVRIFTGAPVPEGTAAVLLQEDVSRDGDRITLPATLGPQTHIRRRGQDFALGDALAAPRRITARDVALLAAMNVAEVTVARRPVVAILATGDELVMPGEQPGPEQIICSNSFALAALAESAGAEARILPIARDTEDSLRFAFGLAEGADLLVTSGGVSVGEHDLVGKVAADLGMERAFWKIAMRPGKPLMAGRIGGAAMLGLPGNPVSAVVCGQLFLLPLLAALQGLSARPAPRRAVLGVDVGATGPRSHYMRARLAESDGLPVITPMDNQDSALLRFLAEADALLIRPLGDTPRRAGEVVEYLPL